MVERKIREQPAVVITREAWMLAATSLTCELQEQILQAQLSIKNINEAISGALNAEDLGLRVIYQTKDGTLTMEIKEKDKMGFNTSKEKNDGKR